MTVDITTGALPFDVVISCSRPEIINVLPNEPINIIIDMTRDGVDGDKGDKGDTGNTGATGAQGIQGLKGDKGDTGNAGATGATGAQGIQGIKGDTGEQGIQGLKGDKGDDNVIITSADSGAKIPLSGTIINTIVATFPTEIGLFHAFNTFQLKLNVFKMNTIGSCTVRVYFNTTVSISNGSQVLLSTSTLSVGNYIGNISKFLISLPRQSSIGLYAVSNPTTSSFIDYATFSMANTFLFLPSDQSGFFIIAFQLSSALEVAYLSSFNLSKI